jgi:peroxiredoxin
MRATIRLAFPQRFALKTILLLLSLTIPAGEMQAAEVGPDIGKHAPSFELWDLSEKVVTLSEYRGKVVLLNFWSTLCVPCTAEMPSLNGLHAALGDKGLHVIAVSIDASDRPVKNFVEEKRIAFMVLRDPEKEVFFDEFAGPSLPASYLIDRNGIIREKFNGPREWDAPDMQEKIMKLLKKDERRGL